MISKEIERQLGRAAEYAKQKGHEFVTLEHLLLSMTGSPATVEILQSCGANVQSLRASLTEYIKQNCPQITKEQLSAYGGQESWMPEFTMACHRLLQRAALQVQNAGRDEVSEGNILVSLYMEKNSFAVYSLQEQGVTQFDVINFISHGEAKSALDAPPHLRPAQPVDPTEAPGKQSPLESFVSTSMSGLHHSLDWT